MKKLLLALSLVSSAALSMAVDVVASYDGDAFVGGVNVVSTSGYVNIEWSGYEAPYYGRTAWRVVVWDPQVSNYPIANELVLASSLPQFYSRNYVVGVGHPVRVELYAAANQYWNSPLLSHNIATYLWVSPLDTYQPAIALNKSVTFNPYAYPTAYYRYPTGMYSVWQ